MDGEIQLSDEERLASLRLARTERVGPVLFRQLLQRFGSASAAIEALPDLARRGGRSALAICSRADAEEEIERLADLGGQLLVLGTGDYPAALAAADTAPPVIAVRGRTALLDKAAVAVVGARNASANGRRLARTLASDLAGEGTVVVSGLARGIDTAAHEGALEGGTVAVVAGGIDVPYPRENAPLFEAVAERGVVIAELPPGTTPQARHFPRRNRIIAGLSLGVVVVEAAARSGSLITARLAGEQGREVLAVPGSPLDPRCRGTNDLLRSGATLVETADDVLAAIGGMTAAPSPPSPAPDPSGVGDDDGADADGARRNVLESLGVTPILVDDLIRESGVPAAIVSTVLIELELAGEIERHPGNRVALLA